MVNKLTIWATVTAGRLNRCREAPRHAPSVQRAHYDVLALSISITSHHVMRVLLQGPREVRCPLLFLFFRT